LFNSTIRDNVTLGETFEEGQKHKALYNSTLIGDLSSMIEGTTFLLNGERSLLMCMSYKGCLRV
ncbi:MAG: hypothetical protein NC313_16065, partial [Butyrivibrio sp.]|nr:hypothetical protein [Butyrivibrio sp.]